LQGNLHPVKCTDHAYERAKYRFKWKKSTLDRMAHKAYNHGITYYDAKGRLKKWMGYKYSLYKHVNNIRIYGQNVYFFSGNLLVTLYRLETKLLKHLNYVNT
jgi:hypothetical protein